MNTRTESYAKLNAGPLDASVLDCIQRSGGRGVTCFEIEDQLRTKHETASGSIWRLRGRGLVYADGKRPNPGTGRNCEILRFVTDLDEAQEKDPRCGGNPTDLNRLKATVRRSWSSLSGEDKDDFCDWLNEFVTEELE